MIPRTRAAWHGLTTTALVLAVCAVVAAFAFGALVRARAELSPLTGRTRGEVTGVDQKVWTVDVSWVLSSGRRVAATVPLEAPPPETGVAVLVAYDPANPSHAVIPGAALVAEADRASGELLFVLVVMVLVAVISAWRAATRVRLPRRHVESVSMRRIRVQKGLLARSWLETERTPRRWIPVYFDPSLVVLATPSPVRLYGDPWRDRLVAAEIAGTVLYPSGPVTKAEPRGRRVDNPSQVDDSVRSRAVTTRGAVRQTRADAALVVPAPLVGLLWSYVDGGGFPSWLAATLISAALALWLAALRGSDPS
ncbi:MAG: hypothetical protein JO285_04475 [Kutzneria sp.]|nr:hypothetical protein [Kutzneria sp.]